MQWAQRVAIFTYYSIQAAFAAPENLPIAVYIGQTRRFHPDAQAGRNAANQGGSERKDAPRGDSATGC